MTERKTVKMGRESARKFVKECGGIRKAAKQLGVSYTKLYRLITGTSAYTYIEARAVPKKPETKSKSKYKKITLSTLEADYDPVVKLLEVIHTVEPGTYISDADLLENCNMPVTRFKRARRDKRLAAQQLKLPDGDTIWGSQSDIQKARRVITRGI